ncbi:MAG: hypothetical protein J6A19_15610 [Oscillospiraceae bacterium]|nr:hypothetical protein [Oscillospiraceae bacterium]
MSNLYENIEYLCAQNNTNITQMCKSLGIVRSALSELASGRTKNLSSDNKAKIAAYFMVDIEYLNENISENPCPLCGLNYSSSDKSDIANHEKRHNKWRAAVKHFGFCWNYQYRENAKARARNMLNNEAISLTDNEQAECYETIYKALFSRALEANNYALDCIPFEDYVAAILYNKKNNAPDVNSNAYKLLADKYGVHKGNVSGTYFDDTQNNDVFLSGIQKKSNSKFSLEISNPDIRMIARAGQKMTPEQAENLRKYAQFMFPEAFKND